MISSICCFYPLSFSQNYITSIESNETNLASAVGELLFQSLQYTYITLHIKELININELLIEVIN